MIELFDIFQILAWTATYILIIVHSFGNRGLRMPLLAGAVNLVWETTALIQSPHWGHILWIVFDIIIFFFNINNISRRGCKASYIFSTVIAIVLTNSIAIHFIAFENWMLLSSFLVDLMMATDYLLSARKIATQGKIAIAVVKLIGDIFAWLAYASQSRYVFVIGLIVLLLNMTYLCYCLEESARLQKKGSKN